MQTVEGGEIEKTYFGTCVKCSENFKIEWEGRSEYLTCRGGDSPHRLDSFGYCKDCCQHKPFSTNCYHVKKVYIWEYLNILFPCFAR